jgi:hypothetical protein
MGGMTVGTKHGAFENPVPRWEIKLGPDFQMAGKAKIRLFAFEEFCFQRSPVHSMTIIAPYGS